MSPYIYPYIAKPNILPANNFVQYTKKFRSARYFMVKTRQISAYLEAKRILVTKIFIATVVWINAMLVKLGPNRQLYYPIYSSLRQIALSDNYIIQYTENFQEVWYFYSHDKWKWLPV